MRLKARYLCGGRRTETAVNAAIALEPHCSSRRARHRQTLLAQEIAAAIGAPFIAWHVNRPRERQQGLYEYDAVSRLRDSQLGDPPRVRESPLHSPRKLWRPSLRPFAPYS